MAKLIPGLAAVALMATMGSAPAESKSLMSMDRLQPTGKTQFCISGDRIKRTKIIDNETILFLTYDEGYFVNKLPRRCGGLKIANGFTFDTRGTNDVCGSTTIDLINSDGKTGQFCGLGRFEKYVRTDEKAEAKKTQ